jgi:hypothetical protein
VSPATPSTLRRPALRQVRLLARRSGAGILSASTGLGFLLACLSAAPPIASPRFVHVGACGTVARGAGSLPVAHWDAALRQAAITTSRAAAPGACARSRLHQQPACRGLRRSACCRNEVLGSLLKRILCRRRAGWMLDGGELPRYQSSRQKQAWIATRFRRSSPIRRSSTIRRSATIRRSSMAASQTAAPRRDALKRMGAKSGAPETLTQHHRGRTPDGCNDCERIEASPRRTGSERARTASVYHLARCGRVASPVIQRLRAGSSARAR